MSRWKDKNNNMDRKHIRLADMDCIYLAQDRGQVAFCCESGNKPSGFINARNMLSKRRAISCSRILLHGFSQKLILRGKVVLRLRSDCITLRSWGACRLNYEPLRLATLCQVTRYRLTKISFWRSISLMELIQCT